MKSKPQPALNLCLTRLDVIERAPAPFQDPVAIETAVSTYLTEAGPGRDERALAMHRLIAAYVGSRPWSPENDEVTTKLTEILRLIECRDDAV